MGYLMRMHILGLLTAVFASTILYFFGSSVEWVPAFSLSIAGLLFGLVSPLIAARRLYFLAGAAPHSGLFAALGAIIVSYLIGIGVSNTYELYSLSIVIGVLAIYIAGYMVFRGVDPDIAASTLVAFTSSMSVVEAYYVKTSLPVPFDVLSVVFGDPLLVTSKELLVVIATLVLAILVVVFTYHGQVYLGIDRDLAMLSGIKLWAYDLALFTLLGALVVSLIRVVGFILEHILLLLPGAIASLYARSSRDALIVSVLVSLIATSIGMLVSLVIPIAPSGAIGLSMLGIYVALILLRR
jgi:zinc/manganese transport system permease protein